MYVCTYVRTYACMYVCMHVCMYVCMYIYLLIGVLHVKVRPSVRSKYYMKQSNCCTSHQVKLLIETQAYSKTQAYSYKKN
jgi:hypothetical protein